MPMFPGRQRFDNFATGPSNRAALSAARAVAGAPGAVYNPLFLHGGAGLGKTHLLAALGHAVRAAWTDAVIEQLPVAEFASQRQMATAAMRLDGFRRRFGAVDVLLLDDVHQLAGEAELQAELLRLCTALRQNAGQVVCASRLAPDEITDLDSGLRDCLTSGSVVALEPLDYDTRVALLRHAGADRAGGLAPDVFETLARHPFPSVPALMEALAARLGSARPPAAAVRTTAPPAPTAAVVVPPPAPVPDEYASFLEEIASAVSRSVEQWRLRLGESVARWSGEGFRTAQLERHLDAADVPDLESLEAAFVAAVNRLRTLEAEAVRLDPKLSGLSVFRDPERLAEAEDIVLRAFAAHEPPPGPNRHLRLEQLVSGAGNHLALRAVAEVVALLGGSANPLVLHGPEGAGKTHLLHGIGNALLAREGAAVSVACLDAATFAAELTTAWHEGTIDRWRMRYRAVDAVLLDDVQQLLGNSGAEAELLQLLQACLEANRPVVVTADRAPADLAFGSALVTLLQDGLVVEVGRVTEAERVALRTPVPAGAEAAAPTIDAFFEPRESATPVPRAAAFRAILGELDPFFLDPEKVVMDWPGIDGRAVEEFR